MKKIKSSGSAMSTDAKPFSAKGSTKGIPASVMMVKPVATKSKKASFVAGKKAGK